jgi:hypothetical protein
MPTSYFNNIAGAFEKADMQITRTKAYRQSLVLNRQLTILSQWQLALTGRKTVFCVLRLLEQFKNSKTSRAIYCIFILHVNKIRMNLMRQSL